MSGSEACIEAPLEGDLYRDGELHATSNMRESCVCMKRLTRASLVVFVTSEGMTQSQRFKLNHDNLQSNESEGKERKCRRHQVKECGRRVRRWGVDCRWAASRRQATVSFGRFPTPTGVALCLLLIQNW